MWNFSLEQFSRGVSILSLRPNAGPRSQVDDVCLVGRLLRRFGGNLRIDLAGISLLQFEPEANAWFGALGNYSRT